MAFELQPSRLAYLFFSIAVFFSGFSVLILWYGVPGWGIKLFFFLILLPWIYYEWALFRKKYKTWALRFNRQASSVWQFCDSSGVWQDVEILSSTVVTAWCVLLHLRLDNKASRFIPIFSDQFAASQHDFRQLRVALRER